MTSTSEVALRRPVGAARQTRFLLDVFERHDARVDPLGASVRIGNARQFERCLVLPKTERRTVWPAEHDGFPQGLHQRAVRTLTGEPGHGGNPRLHAMIVGHRKQAVPVSVDQPADNRGSRHQAAQPGDAHQRFRQPGRDLEILGIRLQGADCQGGNRSPKCRQTLLAAVALGQPLGVARAGAGIPKTKVDRGWRVVFSQIDPGRLVPGQRCQNCLKVGRLEFRNHCEATRGLVGYDTIHAVATKARTGQSLEIADGMCGSAQRRRLLLAQLG